jgi:hypothetical protein
LEGFTYDRLGQFGTEAGDEMLHRKFTWYLDWLARDASPQPYEQLAATFRKAGDLTRADDVLYAGRESVRKSAWRRGSRLRWLGLSLLKWTIGYGIGLRYFLFPLRWVLGLAALSTGVLLATGQPLTCESVGAPSGCLPHKLPGGLFSRVAERFIYSLGQLLPIVELDPTYKDVRLRGWVWLYFVAIVKPFGYVLAAAIVAGMAGLTQRGLIQR